MPTVLRWFSLMLMAALAGEAQAAPASPDRPVQPNWVVADYHSDTLGNTFYAGEVVKLGLTLTAVDDSKPLSIKGGTWKIKEIGENWFPWHADIRVRETGVVSGEGTIPAQSALKIPVTINWKPDRLGAYAIYLTLDDGSRAPEQVVWGFAVTYPPAKGRKLDSPVVFDAGGASLPSTGPAYKRLGAKWIRVEIGWASNEPERGQWRWDGSDEWVKAARDNDIYAMAVMAHAPAWAQPRVEAKYPIVYWGQFPETNVTRQFLPQWQEWARRFVERYKDTVRVGIALNEPWDGGSLSGWHGNGGHYREILRGLSLGAHAADPTFTILANDSSMNCEDNILSAPGTIDLMDGVSVHTYRSYNGAMVAQFAAYGKRVWDTESWIGSGPSEMVHQLVTQLGQGYVKMQPMNSTFIYLGEPPSKIARLTKKAAMAKKAAKKGATARKAKAKPAPAAKAPQATKASAAAAAKQAARAKKVIFTTPSPAGSAPAPMYASPTGQAISVLLHFIEDTDFYREPRRESVPWMYVFKGRAGGPSAERNVATIQGHEHQWGNFPWYRVQSDGTLTIANADGALTAYDLQGNPLAAGGPALQVPLTTAVYYVVSSKGADDLVERLRTATIGGLEPLQLALHDLTGPLAENPPLRVTVTNAYNMPLSGKVEIKAPAGWTLASDSLPFRDLAPGAATELSFAVVGAKAVPANRYPFTVTATTDKGSVKLSENLSSTVIVKGTPPLDGKAKDWEKLGAVPVYLSGGKTSADSFLQYAMPFLNLQEENDQQYFVEFMGMWDDNNFYILADINDPTEKLGPSMKNGTWFQMYPAPNDWEYWGPSFTPGAGGDRINIAFNVLPYGEKQIANFPPEAQKKVDPRWRVNVADYEYSLYLGKQNKQPADDFAKAWKAFKAAGTGRLRAPSFVEVGPPVPEVWRLMAPGLARRNFLPLCPTSAKDQGLVETAKLRITREGNVYHYRAAMPWSELALVRPLAAKGDIVKFTFACKNDGRTAVAWSNEGRSIARNAQEVLHPTWEGSWSPDTEWRFVGAKSKP